MPAPPYLSVIVPAYRQARTIAQELVTLRSVLAKAVPAFEIILVIDGNEDQTFAEITRTATFPELRVECFAHNQGKGVAVRHGFRVARGYLVAFLDAGGDLEPRDLIRMVQTLTRRSADIVIGSKRHPASAVVYPPLRRVYSFLYQWLNRLLFQLEVRDTQVGMKLFRRDVLQASLPFLTVARFAFDLELLVVAHTLGFRRIVEAPITLTYRFSTTISGRAVCQVLWDTVKIYYRTRLLGLRRRPPAMVPPVTYAHPLTGGVKKRVPAGIPAASHAHRR